MPDAIKAAIFAICVPLADEVPLEPPPMSSEESGLVCPDCGAINAVKAEVENASVARCPDCQCEFSMSEHQQSALVLDLLTEYQQRRRAVLQSL